MKITIRNISSFEEKIEKLNRRAKRLGVPKISFTVIEKRREKADHYEVCGLEYKKVGTVDIEVSDIEVHNTDPIKLNGWSFAATSENVGGTNVVLPIPGVEIPSKFLTYGCKCDHCNITRNRTALYIVTNGHEWKQVGKQCLKDFVGEYGAGDVARIFEFYGDIYTDISEYCRSELLNAEGDGIVRTIDLHKVVATTVSVVREFGYISASKATGPSTKDVVKIALGDRNFKRTEEDEKKAEEIIEFFRNLPHEDILVDVRKYDEFGNFTGFTKEPDQYKSNLVTICKAGYCSNKTLGIAVSIVPAIDNIINARLRREADEELRANSEFAGSVGERIEIKDAVVLRGFSYDTELGTVHKLVIKSGRHTFVVTGPSKILNEAGDYCNIETGDIVNPKATVKEHKVHNGIKQTTLSRPSKTIVKK